MDSGQTRDSGGDVELALGAGNDGMELRGSRFHQRGFELEQSGSFAEGDGIWSEQLEAEKLAAGWSVSGRMRRVGAPLDEEGEQTVCVVFHVQRFPVQDIAVRPFARTGSGSFSSDASSREVGCEHLNVA